MEVRRSKPLGLVPLAVGTLGLAALVACGQLLGSLPTAPVVATLAAAVPCLALGIGLASRPHRILVRDRAVTVASRLRTRLTFPLRSLDVRPDPGTPFARLALEAAIVAGVIACARAAAGHDDAVVAAAGVGALYLRQFFWRCSPSLVLAGPDASGTPRQVWLDPRDFDDPGALEAALLSRRTSTASSA